jgi:hypothetical protein
MMTTRILGAAGAMSLGLIAAWTVGCGANDAGTITDDVARDAAAAVDARAVSPIPDAASADIPDAGRGSTSEDAGVSCHPPTLHPPTAGVGVYCPYSSVDGGRDLSCATATQQCCETASDDAGPSTCVAAGSTCPAAGSTIWQCEDPSNCPAGQVCCAAATLEQDTACGYFRAAPGFGGTRCAASCAAGELTVCEQQSECATGTCTPFRAAGNSVGACR